MSFDVSDFPADVQSEIKRLEAEVSMLRGDGCQENGDPPCGHEILCALGVFSPMRHRKLADMLSDWLKSHRPETTQKRSVDTNDNNKKGNES